jgi:protoporphyrin/coproporphyrin ferrochelatase
MTVGAGDSVLLIAHGTVDSLDDLPAFLKNIRRGHDAPPELLAEVRRRYEAIGGQSPLNAINREIAKRLEARLGVPVRTSNRLFSPYPKDVLAELVGLGAKRVVVVPLAQHSAKIYGDAVKEAVREANLDLHVDAASDWGRTPELTLAFARSILQALEAVPASEREHTTLLLTAHSLPVSVIQAGDSYEVELRASAEDVAARVRELGGQFADHAVAFQSQGMSTGPGGRPMAWLGPDLRTCFAELAARGRTQVVVAPIGFLADHVEILYDLDIEARSWAEELGITLRRAPSLNASDGLVDALAAVVRSVTATERATPQASQSERA